MRISAKGRYALAATINMALSDIKDYITLISISDKLGISKIYLEQVFSLLKRGGIVLSIKGSQGGYQLTRTPNQITVNEVLSAVETSMFEPTEDTVKEKAADIEAAMKDKIFASLDLTVKTYLQNITIYDLATEAAKHNEDQSYMFFI